MFPNFFSSQEKIASPLELDLFEPNPIGKLIIGNQNAIARESLFAYDVGAIVCCSESLYSVCKTLPIQFNTKITMVDPTFIAHLESPQLQEVMMFIADGLKKHKNVLVFCESGLGKSAILTSFFLMKTYHISLAQAVNLIERSQSQRLRLNQSLSQLAVDFEMHLFNRNSMMVDGGTLLVLPDYVEGVRIERPKRQHRSGPFNLLATIMILFAVIIALLAQMPTSQREKVLGDIQNLVEEQAQTLTPSDSSVAEESLVGRMSSLFKTDERQEMFDKCRLSSAAATEFLQARDSLRQVVVSFSEVYQKSYTDYHSGVMQYEKSSNLTSILQQQLLILNLQEQQFAQQDQLVAAADTVQKINQVERQLDKLARERKSLVKDRMSPLRDDYYRRVKAIVDTIPTKNDTIRGWITASSGSLSETKSTLNTFVHQERVKMEEREGAYREQVRISQLELEEAKQQLQALITQSNEAMESLQNRLAGVQIDLQEMDQSLSQWTKIIDSAIAVASEGSEAPKHLPQHHHRDHPHLIQALRDEIEAIRRTSLLGQQVFAKEIETHTAKYQLALELLQKLEQEKLLFESKVTQANQHLSRWQALIDYTETEQQGFSIPYADMWVVSQHLRTSQSECLNVMSLEVTATIATNALSTGALVTECTSREIRDLQAHVLQVQSDVEPKHQQYIIAKNEHLKIMEKKRRFNDTIEAMEFQKESLVLQRKYQEAQRILQDIAEEKRAFETIDEDILRKEQFANAAEIVWHNAERELQRWISELRVEVAQEQRTLYPNEVLAPRLAVIVERMQSIQAFQKQLVVASRILQQSASSTPATEDDVVANVINNVAASPILDPIRSLYDAERQHVASLIDQLAGMNGHEHSIGESLP
jgi:hypothetical protein